MIEIMRARRPGTKGWILGIAMPQSMLARAKEIIEGASSLQFMGPGAARPDESQR